MPTISLASLNDFAEWRQIARSLLLDGVTPDEVNWSEPGQAGDLFEAPVEEAPKLARRAVGTVPQRFLELAETAIAHSDPERFALLYRLLWRLQRDHALLASRSDPDVGKLDRRVSAVRRDAHKMTAFVRFRKVIDDAGAEQYLAWFEPEHYILEPTAPFFVRRFTGMNWGIVTPYRAAFWDGEALRFGPGGNKADVPAEDAVEDWWCSYYASIFNPARLKVAMMKSEMPMKYWRNLPEAELIPSLIRTAKAREETMIEKVASQPPSRHLHQQARRPEVADPLPITSLAAAEAAVQECRRCPLYEHATQAVFGEGPEHAEIMFVGEQPGDQEDLAGKPFVGPAGQIFNAALGVAGIDRDKIYVTNAVKHFKFEPRGKRRIHQKPNSGEIQACRFWVGLERQFVRPKLIVAMGATAAHSLTGKSATISALRGRPVPLEDGTPMWVTVHPSFLLRIQDRNEAAAEQWRFEADLGAIKAFADTL